VALFYWWLSHAPGRILYISKKLISYFYSYFSINLLLKTLFDPWKKDEIDTTNMAMDDIIKVWFMNLISRVVGASVRSITIMVGLGAIAGVFIGSVLFFIGFILLPVLVVFLIINGSARFISGAI